MNLVRGFFYFWYDFLVGDAWDIAAGVVVAFETSKFAQTALQPFCHGSGFATATNVLASQTTVRDRRGAPGRATYV